MLKRFIDSVFGYPTLLIYSIFKWSRKIDKHKMFLCFLMQELIIALVFLGYIFEDYRSGIGIFIFIFSLLFAAPVIFLISVGFPTSASDWLYIIKGDVEKYKRQYEKQLKLINKKKHKNVEPKTSVTKTEEKPSKDTVDEIVKTNIEEENNLPQDECNVDNINDEVITTTDCDNSSESVDIKNNTLDDITLEEVQAIGDMFGDLVSEDTTSDFSENKDACESDVVDEDSVDKSDIVEFDIDDSSEDVVDFDKMSIEFNIEEEIEEHKNTSKLESFLDSLDIGDDEEI